MSAVWMRHPTLPRDQLIEVTEDAVAHHRRSGWEICDPPAEQEPPAAPEPADPAPPQGGAETPDIPARRRTAKKAEE